MSRGTVFWGIQPVIGPGGWGIGGQGQSTGGGVRQDSRGPFHDNDKLALDLFLLEIVQ